MYFFVQIMGLFHSGMMDPQSHACQASLSLAGIAERSWPEGVGGGRGDCRKVRQGAPSPLRSAVLSAPRRCPKPVAITDQRDWASQSERVHRIWGESGAGEAEMTTRFTPKSPASEVAAEWGEGRGRGCMVPGGLNSAFFL